jgi:hypothetical protein
MRSIIFLDDDQNRTRDFLNKIGEVPSCEIHTPTTATEAIERIKAFQSARNALIDNHSLSVFLDHDLGGEIYVDSNREDCGMEVVRWIVANKPTIEQLVVHTHNVPAGQDMKTRLMAAGYDVDYIPFSTLLSLIG